VTGTSVAGCTALATVSVTVNPNLVVSASATSPSICMGSCTDLTGNGAATYVWNPGGLSGTTVNVCPAATTTYSVTGTSGAGCTGSNTVTVTVLPNPVVTASALPTAICVGQSSTLTANGATTYLWQPGGLAGSSISVSPALTTIYTVIGTTGICSDTNTVTLTVNPNPTVSATATPATICNGQSTDLTGSGANTYSWLPGSLSGSPVNVSPTSTTIYTVTGTSAAGCTGVGTVTVTVNPLPLVTASATSPSICLGSCTDLTAGGASTYVWNPGGMTGTTINVCPGTNTTYTVTGTSAAGCTGQNTVSVTVVANPVTTASATLNPICVGQSTTLQGGGASAYVWQPGGMVGSSVVVSPIVTTTYTVTGTSGNCSSSATITITVNPVPSLNITPANPAICNGQSVALTLNSTVALSGCSWNPTTGLTPSNSCNPTANPTVTTTYNVQGQTAQGCTNTASVTVTVNANPTVTVSSSAPGNTICNGQCTQLTANSIPAASSWAWLPATGLSSTSIFNPNACPTANTTYTVTSQTAAGCTGSNTIAIIVNPLPVLTVTPQPANICTGGSIQLSVTGVPALSSCTWTPNNTLTPSTGSCSPTANPTVNTIYTVTGQSAAGCTSSTTATVTVNPNPGITITPASASICIGSSTTLQANSIPPGLVTTWAWLPVAGVNPANSSNPTVNPTTTTVYTVTGTSAAGCTGSTSVTVTVNPLPVLSFSPLPTLCVSSPAFILSQASPSGGTYSGTGVSLGTFSPSIAGVGTHTITYTYTDPITNCTNTINQSITINSGIPVSVTPVNPFICPGASVTLTASGAGSYVWTPPLGLNVLTGPVVIATPPSSIIYTVTGTNSDGCSGMNTTTINYYNTSQVGIIAVPNDGCNPLNVTLNFSPANLIANGTWNWQFGDYYSNINTSSDSTATHLYQHEGNFIVTFTGLDINGCSVTATTNVDVYIKPHADFYNTPEVGYSQDPTITFVDLSFGANYWIWDFGDPGSYNDNFAYNMNPVHVFSDSGTYTIMLVVMSSHNCSDTAYHDVIIYPEPIVYIPNAFTPNSDRLNDVFRPIITGFDKSTYKFYIFDRWGREVFFSNDVYTGWDGKHKGKPIEIGVYSYIVYFNEYTGKEHKIIGSVTLIR
ncbi:MAG: PKD-like domain-containing protein, partial [Bacteroidota bacterium]